MSHISKYNYETFYFGDVYKPSELSLNNLTPQAKDALIKKGKKDRRILEYKKILRMIQITKPSPKIFICLVA